MTVTCVITNFLFHTTISALWENTFLKLKGAWLYSSCSGYSRSIIQECIKTGKSTTKMLSQVLVMMKICDVVNVRIQDSAIYQICQPAVKSISEGMWPSPTNNWLPSFIIKMHFGLRKLHHLSSDRSFTRIKLDKEAFIIYTFAGEL